MQPIAAVLTTAVLLAGAAPAVLAQPMEKPRAESLYGATFDDRGLTLRVGSNGCTKKEDFSIRVRRHGREQTLLATRLRADHCRAFVRDGVNLTWSLQELGLDHSRDVRILNRFSVW